LFEGCGATGRRCRIPINFVVEEAGGDQVVAQRIRGFGVGRKRYCIDAVTDRGAGRGSEQVGADRGGARIEQRDGVVVGTEEADLIADVDQFDGRRR
jgi:hypothetical protein